MAAQEAIVIEHVLGGHAEGRKEPEATSRAQLCVQVAPWLLEIDAFRRFSESLLS